MPSTPTNHARLEVRRLRQLSGRRLRYEGIVFEKLTYDREMEVARLAFEGGRCQTIRGSKAWTVLQEGDEAQLYRGGSFVGAWDIPIAIRSGT